MFIYKGICLFLEIKVRPTFGGKHVEAYRNQDTVGREPNFSVSSYALTSHQARVQRRLNCPGGLAWTTSQYKGQDLAKTRLLALP